MRGFVLWRTDIDTCRVAFTTEKSLKEGHLNFDHLSLEHPPLVASPLTRNCPATARSSYTGGQRYSRSEPLHQSSRFNKPQPFRGHQGDQSD